MEFIRTEEGFTVKLADLPEIDGATEDSTRELNVEFERLHREDPNVREVFGLLHDIEEEAVREFGELGPLGCKETLELIRAYREVGRVAAPIYSWCPAKSRLAWIKQGHSNRVADLYRFVWSFAAGRGDSREDVWRLLREASFANGLVRAAYGSLRHRLDRSQSRRRGSVGVALLRVLLGDDELAVQALRETGVGSVDGFSQETSESAFEILATAARFYARKKWDKGLRDFPDVDRELALDAVVEAIAQEMEDSKGLPPVELALVMLGEKPGHVVANGGGKYSNAVTAELKRLGVERDSLYDPVGGEGGALRIDLIRDTTTPPVDETLRVALSMRQAADQIEDKVLELYLEDPGRSVSEVAGLVGVSEPTVHRRRASLRKKYARE